MENKTTGSLDTNTLLRLCLGDIPEQAYSVKNLLERSNWLEVADAVVFEMIFVMERVYKLDRERIVRNVLTAIRHPKINCNRKLFELTLPLYIQEPKLSIVDCALTEYAKLNNATPLFTFDADLAKACHSTVVLLT